MSTPQQDWDPCPHGELARMVQARRRQRRRRIVDRAAAVGACLMICLAVGGYTLGLFTPEPSPGGNSGGDFGGLACSEVRDALPAYIAGEIDPPMHERVARHLRNCPHCRSRYDELRGKVSAVSRSRVLIAAARN